MGFSLLVGRGVGPGFPKWFPLIPERGALLPPTKDGSPGSPLDLLWHAPGGILELPTYNLVKPTISGLPVSLVSRMIDEAKKRKRKSRELIAKSSPRSQVTRQSAFPPPFRIFLCFIYNIQESELYLVRMKRKSTSTLIFPEAEVKVNTFLCILFHFLDNERHVSKDHFCLIHWGMLNF